MTRQEITEALDALAGITAVLAEADPADKADLYAQLGLHLTYQPAEQQVIAEAKPQATMYGEDCPRSDSATTHTPCTASNGCFS